MVVTPVGGLKNEASDLQCSWTEHPANASMTIERQQQGRHVDEAQTCLEKLARMASIDQRNTPVLAGQSGRKRYDSL
jgi:hypothetical protein